MKAEEENIKRVLLAVKGNRDKAAEILDMHRSTLWRKMKEFRIDKNFGKKNQTLPIGFPQIKNADLGD